MKGNSMRKHTPEPCLECGGRGWVKAYNSATDHTEIQKCARCRKYGSDRIAVEAVVEIYTDMVETLERVAGEMESASSAGVSVDSKWLDKRITVARAVIAKARGQNG